MQPTSKETPSSSAEQTAEYRRGYEDGMAASHAEVVQLKTQLKKQKKSESLLKTAFKISELAHDPELTIESMYESVQQELSQIIDASNFYIARLEDNGSRLNFVFYRDSFDLKYEYPQDFPMRPFGKGFTEMAIESKKTLLLSRQQITDLCESGKVDPRRNHSSSWLGAPLLSENEVLGALVIQSYDDELVYDESDAELLTFVSQHVSDAILRYEQKENEKSEKLALEQAAKRDSLTGLFNRESFHRMLDEVVRGSDPIDEQNYAVLFIDLDGFKQVNDQYGHLIGDELLNRVAQIFLGIVRSNDVVGRLGGDEFVILLKQLHDQDEAVIIAKRIIAELDSPMLVNDESLCIGASIGIAFGASETGSTEQIMQAADAAMYEAKSKGKHGFHIA